MNLIFLIFWGKAAFCTSYFISIPAAIWAQVITSHALDLLTFELVFLLQVCPTKSLLHFSMSSCPRTSMFFCAYGIIFKFYSLTLMDNIIQSTVLSCMSSYSLNLNPGWSLHGISSDCISLWPSSCCCSYPSAPTSMNLTSVLPFQVLPSLGDPQQELCPAYISPSNY